MDNAKYEKYYSEQGLANKLKKHARAAGIRIVYTVLLLFYAVQSPKTPLRIKAQIYGALGYWILPLDLVPDFLPGLGYVDDLSALGLALVSAARNIDDEVRAKAKERLVKLFGEQALNDKSVLEVDTAQTRETDKPALEPPAAAK